jgi:hypothetical protein
MSQHITQPRPCCRACGKRLAKATQHNYPDAPYPDRAALQAVVPPDLVITSVSISNAYYDPNGKGYTRTASPVVYSYKTWDGKSYGLSYFDKTQEKRVHPHVCIKKCGETLFTALAVHALPDFKLTAA